MKKNHYLTESERTVIDSKYKKELLYKRLRSLALKADGLTPHFSLSPEDLFYHTLCSLDELIDMMATEEEDEMLYCKDLWLELRTHLGENVECNEEERRTVSTLIVCTLDNILYICNRAKYWDVCDALARSEKENDSEGRSTIDSIIKETLYSEDAFQDIHIWMDEYMHSPQCLSDEIERMILDLRLHEHETKIEHQDEIEEQLMENFWRNRDLIDDFLYSIHGQDCQTVINEIAKRVKTKPARMQVRNKSELWGILNHYGLYQQSVVWFSKSLKKEGI